MSEMKEMTIKVFTDELSSNSPAPGGGSVAALCASISASLASMVFSLTVGKKLYNEYTDDVKNIITSSLEKVNVMKTNFLKLMDEDTEVFNEVMAAFKMPKETDEEKKLRSARIQETYVAAMEVPLKTARESEKIFEFLKLAVAYGNPAALSDAGVGALLAMSALEGAILNVKINLGSIKNEKLVEEVRNECADLLKRAEAQKEDIMTKVKEQIG